MLARAGDLPRGDYAYEVKWDGFRAIVSTEDVVVHVRGVGGAHDTGRGRWASVTSADRSHFLKL